VFVCEYVHTYISHINEHSLTALSHRTHTLVETKYDSSGFSNCFTEQVLMSHSIIYTVPLCLFSLLHCIQKGTHLTQDVILKVYIFQVIFSLLTLSTLIFGKISQKIAKSRFKSYNSTAICFKIPQVSSIGRCLFYRPVDLSWSISTPTVYPNGKMTSTVDLHPVDIDTDRRSTYGKIRSIVCRLNIENFFSSVRSLTYVYRDLLQVLFTKPDTRKKTTHNRDNHEQIVKSV